MRQGFQCYDFALTNSSTEREKEKTVCLHSYVRPQRSSRTEREGVQYWCHILANLRAHRETRMEREETKSGKGGRMRRMRKRIRSRNEESDLPSMINAQEAAVLAYNYFWLGSHWPVPGRLEWAQGIGSCFGEHICGGVLHENVVIMQECWGERNWWRAYLELDRGEDWWRRVASVKSYIW